MPETPRIAQEDRTARAPRAGRWVVVVGLVLVALQAAHRAWVSYPSWFLHDDYLFLLDARRSALTWEYLLDPYSGHVVPFGRLVVWLAGQAGPTPWVLAATTTVLAQVLMSLACLWMLLTVLGRRPVVLLCLALYLTTAITLPASTWWLASVNTAPIGLSFFLAVGSWVRYLRGDGLRWALAAGAAVLFGLAGDVLSLLVLPLLAFLAVGWFASGGPWGRVRSALRRRAAGFGVLVVVGGAYTAYYLLWVPQITTGSGLRELGPVAAETVGTSFAASVLGGPWVWSTERPPTALVATPPVLVSACWVVIALTVAYLALRRRRTLRAWVLLGGYLAMLTVLVASVRSGFEGAERELRFINGVAFVLPLALGLALARLPGATESSEAREVPAVARAPRWVPVVLAAAVLVSGVASSTQYAHIWHTQNAGEAYVARLADDLRRGGAVDVATTPVPVEVLNEDLIPRNNTRTMVELLSPYARFPDATGRLAVVGYDGGLTSALIEPIATSVEGRSEGCGWRVGDAGRTIPLDGRAIDYQWWLRIGYLSGGSSPVVVEAGGETVQGRVDRGLGSLFVRVEAGFDEVRVSGLDPDVDLCIDTIEVGTPVAGGPL